MEFSHDIVKPLIDQPSVEVTVADDGVQSTQAVELDSTDELQLRDISEEIGTEQPGESLDTLEGQLSLFKRSITRFNNNRHVQNLKKIGAEAREDLRGKSKLKYVPMLGACALALMAYIPGQETMVGYAGTHVLRATNADPWDVSAAVGGTAAFIEGVATTALVVGIKNLPRATAEWRKHYFKRDMKLDKQAKVADDSKDGRLSHAVERFKTRASKDGLNLSVAYAGGGSPYVALRELGQNKESSSLGKAYKEGMRNVAMIGAIDYGIGRVVTEAVIHSSNLDFKVTPWWTAAQVIVNVLDHTWTYMGIGGAIVAGNYLTAKKEREADSLASSENPEEVVEANTQMIPEAY